MKNRKLRFEPMEEKTLLTTLWVETNADSGEGSLRDAILAANEDSNIHHIEFQADVDKVKLESTIEYSGSQSLHIVGSGEGPAVIKPASNDLNGQFNLFESTGGADLELRNVEFANGLTGVFVPVPKSATGTLDVTLKDVTIRDNSLLGIHIDDGKVNNSDLDDQLIWDESEDGDLSDDKLSPTIVNSGDNGVLHPGIHRVSGTSTAGEIEEFDEMGPFYPELDVDTFTIVIEAGQQLDAILLDHYSWTNPHGHTGGDGGVPGGGAFLAVQQGEQISDVPSELYGAGLVGILPGAQPGDNILDDLGSGTFSDFGVPTFSGPLGPGTYTFWYQEGPTDTEYTLEFVVSEIAGKNSDASINFVMKDSVIQRNGSGAADADGIRIDEGGSGDIKFRSLNSIVKSNGGDGVELNENGKGGVNAYVHSSTYENNGDYTELDPEDGFDIDESNDGHVWFKVLDSYFNNNADGGIDLDEEGDGVLTLDIMDSESNGNGSDGVSVSEENSGNLIARINHVESSNNDGNGFEIEETNGGDNRTTIITGTSDKNDRNGVLVTEENGGNLNFSAHQLTSYKNSVCGVSLEEHGSGDIDSVLHAFDASANGGTDDNDYDGYGLQIVEWNHGSLDLEIYDPTIEKIKSAEGIYLQENHAGDIDATLREFNINKIDDDDGIEIDEHGPGNLTVDASGMNMSKLVDGIDLWETHGGNLAFRGDRITFDNCDEAIEIEEDGSGNLIAEISNTRINNAYEGFEIEEDDSGDISVKLNNVIVDQTEDEGLEIEEYKGGDLYLEVHNSQFLNSRGEGIDVEENDNGNLTAKLFNVVTSAKEEGVDLRESNAGDLLVESWMLRTSGGGIGISLTEDSKGDLKASLSETTVTGASDDGLYVYEDHNGNLELKVVTMDLTNCGGDAISASENGKGDFSAEFTSGRLQADKYGLSLEEHGGGQGVARAFGVDLEGDLDDYWVENVELIIS